MSLSETSQPLGGVPDSEVTATQAEAGRKFDIWALVQDRTFQLVMLVLAAAVYCFWPLFGTEIWHRWKDMEGYYAHGFLIPFCAAYLIWDKWERIKTIPVKPFWPAIALLLPVLWVSLAASRCIMPTLLSGLFLAVLILGTLAIAGWRWMLALAPAQLFLFFFSMPILDKAIDKFTMPLQIFSTKIAFHTLDLTGFQPHRVDNTTIEVPHFLQPLTIAVACSGLRTTIAILAAVVFFILIARLSWWKNLILASIAIPLSMVVNGIRIALIGMACDTWPQWSGDNFTQMHDISGYVALLLCFLTLGWITKKMGYK